MIIDKGPFGEKFCTWCFDPPFDTSINYLQFFFVLRRVHPIVWN